MKKKIKIDNIYSLAVIAVLAWLVPGAGYFVLGERKKAVLIFISLAVLFTLGLYVGSIGIIDPVWAKAWYVAQICFSPVVAILGNITVSDKYTSFGKPQEIGQIYTSIAGLLNLLCIVSAVYAAYYQIIQKNGE